MKKSRGGREKTRGWTRVSKRNWGGMGREIYFRKGCVIRVWIRETAVNMVHVSVTRDGRLSFQNTRMNGWTVCLISDSLNSKELFRDEAAPR